VGHFCRRRAIQHCFTSLLGLGLSPKGLNCRLSGGARERGLCYSTHWCLSDLFRRRALPASSGWGLACSSRGLLLALYNLCVPRVRRDTLMRPGLAVSNSAVFALYNATLTHTAIPRDKGSVYLSGVVFHDRRSGDAVIASRTLAAPWKTVRPLARRDPRRRGGLSRFSFSFDRSCWPAPGQSGRGRSAAETSDRVCGAGSLVGAERNRRPRAALP